VHPLAFLHIRICITGKNWVEEVKAQIALLPEDWVIAGIVGKDEQGVLCGKFHDMSSPLWIVSEHEFPVNVRVLMNVP